MVYLALGVLLLAGLMFARDAFVKADPKLLAKNIRRIGGNGALILAFVLLVTGRFVAAIPFAVLGYLLVGRLPFVWLDLSSLQGSRAHSTIRSDMLEMMLDQDGNMTDGFVRVGTFAGWRLSELSASQLQSLLRETSKRDLRSEQLLEAYIIARLGGGARNGRSSGNRMTQEEALDVLGLKLGATREEILHAHRTLMKKMHPDLGGSTYLATKINEAKDVLLA
jgi:hypothetical protein